jgi:predicted DNA-binding transcriptional regulator
MTALSELLKELNLNEKEISIFDYLIRFGAQPASVIAKHFHLQRSSCYLHLQKISNQGLLEQIIKNNVTFYSVVSPEIIIKKLQNRQSILKKKLQIAQIELTNVGQKNKELNSFKPKARFFSGVEGILQIMEDVLIEKPTLLYGLVSKEFDQFMIDYTPDYGERRASHQIKVKALHTFGNEPGNWHTDTAVQRTSKYLPPIFNFGLNLLIYNNKIALLSIQEKFGIIIESRIISEAQAKLFEFAWRFAKPI